MCGVLRMPPSVSPLGVGAASHLPLIYADVRNSDMTHRQEAIDTFRKMLAKKHGKLTEVQELQALAAKGGVKGTQAKIKLAAIEQMGTSSYEREEEVKADRNKKKAERTVMYVGATRVCGVCVRVRARTRETAPVHTRGGPIADMDGWHSFLSTRRTFPSLPFPPHRSHAKETAAAEHARVEEDRRLDEEERARKRAEGKARMLAMASKFGATNSNA